MNLPRNPDYQGGMKMNVPMLAAIALAVTVLMSASPAKRASKTLKSQTPGGHSLTRPTLPSQMWIDKAANTVLRNDKQGNNTSDIDAYMRRTYATEAAMHPGVRLMAGKAYV